MSCPSNPTTECDGSSTSEQCRKDLQTELSNAESHPPPIVPFVDVHENIQGQQTLRTELATPFSPAEKRNLHSHVLVMVDDRRFRRNSRNRLVDLHVRTTERNFHKNQMIRMLQEMDEFRTALAEAEEKFKQYRDSVSFTVFVLTAITLALCIFIAVVAFLYGNGRIVF